MFDVTDKSSNCLSANNIDVPKTTWEIHLTLHKIIPFTITQGYTKLAQHQTNYDTKIPTSTYVLKENNPH
jgi:hypothetical protein